MDYNTLLEAWCDKLELTSLVCLSQLNSHFYFTITNTKLKVIIDRFNPDSSSLRECYELCSMKDAYNKCMKIIVGEGEDYTSYINLCIKYDRTYLLDDLIAHANEMYKYFDMLSEEMMFDTILPDMKKIPTFLEHMMRRGYFNYTNGEFIQNAFSYYVGENKLEMVKIFIDDMRNCSVHELIDEPYQYCRSKEMYLLLLSEIGDGYFVHNIQRDCSNITNCIIKYGSSDDKELLVEVLVEHGGLIDNIDRIKDLYKYVSLKHKILLLEGCRRFSRDKIKIVLDFMFTSGDGYNYLGKDYFDFNCSRSRRCREVLEDLIEGIRIVK